jgi:hypothetical protein
MAACRGSVPLPTAMGDAFCGQLARREGVGGDQSGVVAQHGLGVDDHPAYGGRVVVRPALGEHVQHHGVGAGPVVRVRGEVRVDRLHDLSMELRSARKHPEGRGFPRDRLRDDVGMAGGERERDHAPGAEADNGRGGRVEVRQQPRRVVRMSRHPAVRPLLACTSTGAAAVVPDGASAARGERLCLPG